MPSAFLEDRGVVRVAGADARAFLQGLVTCDMDRVSPDKAAYGALLTPQGKVICDFLVSETSEAFHLDCPEILAADLAKRLRLYRLRSKIDVDDLSPARMVAADWNGSGEGLADPRHPRLGTRRIVDRLDGPGGAANNAAAYEAHRIALAIPKGGIDFVYGDAFPHEINLDLMHGVDFKKGCYVGQEVVSRVEHRGAARKRIAHATFEETPPPVGAALLAGEIEIGTMGSGVAGQGLAMVRVDRVEDATVAGLPILADGKPLTLALPAKRR